MPLAKNMLPPIIFGKITALFIALGVVLAICLSGACPFPCCSEEVAGEACGTSVALARHDTRPARSPWKTGDKF